MTLKFWTFPRGWHGEQDVFIWATVYFGLCSIFPLFPHPAVHSYPCDFSFSSLCLPPLTSCYFTPTFLFLTQHLSPDNKESLQFDDIRWLLSPIWNNRFIPPPSNSLGPSPAQLCDGWFPMRFPNLFIPLPSVISPSFLFLSISWLLFSRVLLMWDLWNQYLYLKVKTHLMIIELQIFLLVDITKIFL